MAKYKVQKKFRDKETNEIYETGQEIEMTVKRAEEVEKNLDDSFLVRIDEKKASNTASDDKQEKKKDEK